MKTLQLTLAASVLLGLAALMSAAEARGGGGGFGGGHGGGFGGGHEGGFGPGRDGGFGPRGHEGGFQPGGPGYGTYPGRPNPYARNAVPWVNMDYNDLLQEPANNSGSQVPNDCNYLFKKAMDSGRPDMWKLFNDCSHNR